jgi:hypothetical protein
MRESLTAFILVVVFVASVLNQLPLRRWSALVARYERWTFLPFWAFFAPNPGYAGTHLVFRDRTPHGWTAWTELEVPDTGGWRWLWNPGRFERKALQDLFNGLVRTAKELKQPAALEMTICYLGLLAWVQAQPRCDPASIARQFALLQAVGHGTERTLQAVVVSREYAIADG